jgi:hypothetical protein
MLFYLFGNLCKVQNVKIGFGFLLRFIASDA